MLGTSGLTQKLPLHVSSPVKGLLDPYPGWIKEQHAYILNLWTSSMQRKQMMHSENPRTQVCKWEQFGPPSSAM